MIDKWACDGQTGNVRNLILELKCARRHFIEIFQIYSHRGMWWSTTAFRWENFGDFEIKSIENILKCKIIINSSAVITRIINFLAKSSSKKVLHKFLYQIVMGTI